MRRVAIAAWLACAAAVSSAQAPPSFTVVSVKPAAPGERGMYASPPATAPLDVLVVRSISRPTPN